MSISSNVVDVFQIIGAIATTAAVFIALWQSGRSLNLWIFQAKQ